jgi:hypothetical protein
MQVLAPKREHLRLCLQLILQSFLHNLDAGFTEQKILDLCAELELRIIPNTHRHRLAALQTMGARILPTLN